MLDVAGAPKAAVGVIIAVVVLLPEGLAAMRAARADRLQTSLNLALGSALATIGLTIPAIAALAIVFGWPLALGIAPKDTVLLALSLFAAALSLSTGRTTIMQGALHLMLFGVFLFLIVRAVGRARYRPRSSYFDFNTSNSSLVNFIASVGLAPASNLLLTIWLWAIVNCG